VSLIKNNMGSIFNIILKNYKKSFDFKGRQSRFDYWTFLLFIVFITYAVMYLSNNKIINDNISYLLFINVIPFLSSSARRLHDAEKGDKKTYIGVWFGVSFLLVNLFNVKLGSPYISLQVLWIIVFIIFQCRESNPKPNGYGKLEKF
jgi:uncharacterized membrane protein YhaH (DUF805 family)